MQHAGSIYYLVLLCYWLWRYSNIRFSQGIVSLCGGPVRARLPQLCCYFINITI